ncbi:Rpn family recombination-promoting nuclease/putative transposase [Candidatus Tisiphia endosymbiont of Nemotelus uliginosus]|uniref:Rpn family recombination-promoting nuclease/putative transposase n=1 Tax=Candidatus Tisiphia endosymbiont of Nemotelus uliginosus TaxID=3077926 RepID=UPI0035C91534
MEKITPRIDVAFKKIFGVEENKDLLISLINSIVSSEDQVIDVTLLNPYNPKNFRNDKLSILDIKALGEGGKRFNIEIQITDEADYDKRALYYWAKLYTEQLQASAEYSSLNKAIGIHILNFTSIPDIAKYHNVFHIAEKDSGLLYFKDLELHTIELNKFTNNPKEGLADILKKVVNSLDVWSAFLTRHDLLNKDSLPKELDNASLKKALTVLDVMNFTKEERDAYEDHLKWLRIEANTLKKVEAQAEARGEAKGKAEGKAEGKVEGKAELIKMMRDNGHSVEEISRITKLPITEINKLLSLLKLT